MPGAAQWFAHRGGDARSNVDAPGGLHQAPRAWAAAMKTYAVFSHLFPHSYRAKIMAVMLVCIALPMLALVAWLASNNDAAPERILLGIGIGLAATLVGTVVALLLVYHLLQPLRRAVAALDDYEGQRVLPRLVPHELGQDEMSRLLNGIQRVLHNVDGARRHLEQYALEDPLTEAMNRRGCTNALNASVEEARTGRTPFTLFVVDLDNLKTINDEHGHAAGDFALVSLVRIARECCLGERDWIGRWGGDEFVLGMHADPDIALDRMRVWIEVLSRPVDGMRPVHVSVGAAAWRPGLEAGQLYRMADAVMYQAKFAGGRRVLVHEARDEDSEIASPRRA